MQMIIYLPTGEEVFVTSSDYSMLIKFKWHKLKSRHTDYAVTTIDGHTVRMHRMIMECPKGLVVDHRDHQGLHNERYNLRICTSAENGYNTLVRRDSTTGLKGVRYVKSCKRYRVEIQFQGKRIPIGFFISKEEAGLAYDEKAIEFFGEYACLNFPEESKEGKMAWYECLEVTDYNDCKNL